jgi:transposase
MRRRHPAVGPGPGPHPGGAAQTNRLTAWHYSKAIYRRRNEIERLFRRLKGFRRVFSRFEKLDVMFTALIHFALIADALR